MLAFQIVAEGRTLFYRDPDVLNQFELLVLKRFREYRIYPRKHEALARLGEVE